MPDDAVLREQAHEAIQHGRLPATQPTRMFFGPSEGETCAVCSASVPRSEVALQLEFQHHPPPQEKSLRDTLERLDAKPAAHHYHLHARCFAAWESERAKIGGAERQSI